ncbi:periplasmic heavy metal sensor [Brevundimonas staleyi]|uniref:Periplasmic heavy metal sensor n=1 Tax=Brevundimonas staleyi TaxID=74326 RepID=A0ABW0FW77_9CAUL
MKSRTLIIVLGAALAVSVAVNLFAATAAWTALSGQQRIEQRMDGKGPDDQRPSTHELLESLTPETRDRVRQALRAAGLAARPDFQQARELRRQAVAAAAVEPYDQARVAELLSQSRAAERSGRERLEAEALTILGALTPPERAIFSRILNSKRGGGGGGGGDHRPSGDAQK